MASTQASTTDAERYMTTEDICAMYHVTRRSVYRWRAAGKLPGVKVGRRVLYAREDVERFAHLRDGR